MKTLLKYIIISLVGVTFLTACDGLNDPEMFSQEDAFIAFNSTTAVVSEINTIINIPVKVSALAGAPAVSVTFDFDTEEINNPAVEGEDFIILNDSKTLTVNDGFGYDTIRIKTIDNDLFTGNKMVNIKLVSNSLDYDFGLESALALTINDDDHPLGWMLGDYDIVVTETANGNTNYSVSIVAVEGETDLVKIYGMSGVTLGAPSDPPASGDDFDYSLLGTVSEDYSTVTIRAGQEWDTWGYGPTSFKVWLDDNGEADEAEEMVGTISTDNGVIITFSQQFTFYITEGNNAGLGIQWAWNSDAAPNSPTAVLTKAE
ncbi:hypothetical protein OU798_17710 [Prolixibacteraceae bacterium Z1-6]|uniref:Calx-beta domain-containing protein n=1 Tax=Draconibacterium aestuarii TaxID=2998507 RepID=A0A9X3FFI8_9BACT|nr:hypothetical protein [Prolixibacteraceae bacterium Z1-6]